MGIGFQVEQPTNHVGLPVPRGPRGPSPATSTDAIYAHALGMLEAEGVAALTVRQLAAGLGISTRTLYKRIVSRDQLISGVLALHYATVGLPEDEGGRGSRPL